MTATLTSSARLQGTIVHALIMQDMNRRYGESRFGSLTAIVEPLLLLAGLYFLRVYVQGATKVGGVPIVLFLVTGMLTFFCFRYTINNVASSGRRRSTSLMFPNVTPLDTIVAQIITSCTVYAGVMLSAFVILMLWTGIRPVDCLYVIIGGALTLATASAVGLIFGCIIRVVPSLGLAVSLLVRIDLVFSGGMYIAAEVPKAILPYVDWNPTFHTIEMMREGWFPGYVSPLADPTYVVVLLVFLLAIGLSLERITRSRL